MGLDVELHVYHMLRVITNHVKSTRHESKKNEAVRTTKTLLFHS